MIIGKPVMTMMGDMFMTAITGMPLAMIIIIMIMVAPDTSMRRRVSAKRSPSASP